jgi:hypothetical protein
MAEKRSDWIDELELEDVKIKWAFSHFDGREDTFNAKGEYNFQIILPEDVATKAIEDGWNVREMAPYEEGDPPEFLLKVKISFKYEPPKIFLIKNGRKFRADERDLADIRRDTTERIDVIVTPSRWVAGGNTGISAYVKELYAQVRESRFSAMYADLEEV